MDTNKNGGEGGIRTHGTRKGTLDFESSPFGHSGISPNARQPWRGDPWRPPLYEGQGEMHAVKTDRKKAAPGEVSARQAHGDQGQGLDDLDQGAGRVAGGAADAVDHRPAQNEEDGQGRHQRQQAHGPSNQR